MIEKQILAYHYAKIAGVQGVKQYAPRTIKDAQLPLVVLFADTLATVDRASGLTVKTRDIRAVLFVERVGLGTEESPYLETDPFFDLVDTYFEARPTLALANGTTDLNHEYMGDDGETITPYPSGKTEVSQFWAITFKHRFTIVKQVIYESGA
jgi:hypothetical protein